MRSAQRRAPSSSVVPCCVPALARQGAGPASATGSAVLNMLRQVGLVDEHGNPKPPRTWDELRDYENKLTIFNRPGDKTSGIKRLGFAPNTGNSFLYIFSWQAGGEVMNPDRTKVTL